MYHWFDYFWQVQEFLSTTEHTKIVAEPYGLRKSRYGVFIPNVIKK